jgi:integrase/recombinase XerD
MKIMMQQEVKTKQTYETFKEFIKNCRVKNLSTKTTDYYEECFEAFLKFYPETNNIKDITKCIVDDYILYLRSNTDLNDTSINTRLRGIRAILYYFMELGYVPKFKMHLIKAEKKVKETYSDAELKLLLKKPDIKKCGFTEYRDWMIINYLLSTGSRASTLTNLKIRDIDFESTVLTLDKTKNKKQQIIPMSKMLSQVLIEYLKYRKGNGEDYLFCSAYGCKLTVNALGHSIKAYNQRRGVQKGSIHLLRHYGE